MIPNKALSKLPELYATQDQKNPVVHIAFTHPQTGWHWFATEYDGEDTFFGLVSGFETELGYFNKSELEHNGVQVITDWNPKRLKAVREDLRQVGR